MVPPQEREELTTALRSAISGGGKGTSLYISGTPGTGKTATVHHALRLLAAERGLPPFRTLEVNGMKLSSPQQVYSLLWEGLTGQHASVARAQQLLDKRFSAPSKKRRCGAEVVVLLLDELDYLVTRTQSVIYNLFEWATSGHAPLALIGISNTMDLPERLLPRVHSRLGIRRVSFLPYSHSEIAAIIADRLTGLDAFEPKGVELCARKVAAVSGDIRRALEVCRLAAQLAEREEVRAVGPPAGGGGAAAPAYVDLAHIDKASKQLRGSASLRCLGATPKQQLLLLCCAVLQQKKTGLAEVPLHQLAGHFYALSRRHGARRRRPRLASLSAPPHPTARRRRLCREPGRAGRDGLAPPRRAAARLRLERRCRAAAGAPRPAPHRPVAPRPLMCSDSRFCRRRCSQRTSSTRRASTEASSRSCPGTRSTREAARGTGAGRRGELPLVGRGAFPGSHTWITDHTDMEREN